MSKVMSDAWKSLERAIVKGARANGLEANRVYRGGDFSKKDVDVIIKDLEWIKIDGKYRKRHAHHTFMREIEKKYCVEEGDIPMLVSKGHRQIGAYVTLPLEFVMALLGAVEFED